MPSITTVTLPSAGVPYVVQLPLNAGTGYSWTQVPGSLAPPGALSVTAGTTASATPLPGAAQTAVFFAVLNCGFAGGAVTFQLKRPWEPLPAKLETYVFKTA